MLFVWNDPEGNPPPPEVTIPRIEGAGSEEWTDWHWYTTVVDTNCREIIDNVVDMAHFFYIHGINADIFQEHLRGARRDAVHEERRPRPTWPDTEGAQMLGTTSVASYYGPSFMIDDLTYHYRAWRSENSSDQLPLPDRCEFVCAAIRNHRQESLSTCPRRRQCRLRSHSAIT